VEPVSINARLCTLPRARSGGVEIALVKEIHNWFLSRGIVCNRRRLQSKHLFVWSLPSTPDWTLLVGVEERSVLERMAVGENIGLESLAFIAGFGLTIK
jgi:hypothetical protein